MSFSAHKLLCGVLLLTTAAGCELLHSNDEQAPLALNDITRIVWRLESFEANGTRHTGEDYQPLHLVFVDTSAFVGDDGCNRFGASYTANEPRIFPEDFAVTLLACSMPSFPVNHLREPFEVKIEREDMTVVAAGGLYHYHSDYAEPVAESPLIGGQWRLVASTDSAVQALAGEFVPVLRFDAERAYAITWRCSEGNVFGCNEYSGFWGLGEGKAITLYRTVAQVSNALHAHTIGKLMQASSYSLEAGDLILAQDSVVHRFERQ